jgi:hypothetical protein
MLTKESEWIEFSEMVRKHIKVYVEGQYGDYPDEMIEGWDLRSIKESLDRYVTRIDAGERGIDEAKRDALKIAHFGCYLMKKLNE